MDKFRNSWELVKASASVLKSDKELVIFPILSGVAVLILTIFFAVAAFGTGRCDHRRW